MTATTHDVIIGVCGPVVFAAIVAVFVLAVHAVGCWHTRRHGSRAERGR